MYYILVFMLYIRSKFNKLIEILVLHVRKVDCINIKTKQATLHNIRICSIFHNYQCRVWPILLLVYFLYFTNMESYVGGSMIICYTATSYFSREYNIYDLFLNLFWLLHQTQKKRNMFKSLTAYTHYLNPYDCEYCWGTTY